MGGIPGTYSFAQRQQVLGLLEQGLAAMEVARRVGVDRRTVGRWAKVAGMTFRMGPVGGLLRPTAPVIQGDFTDPRGRLTEAGRALIAVRLREGQRPARIAAELGVHRSSVSRELTRHRVAGVYSVRVAQARAVANRARPQPRKLDRAEYAALRAAVIEGLNAHWSPQQIQGELALRYPQDESMQISHETLYQALYVQGRGSLRAELARDKALRSGRTSRVPASKLAARPRGKSWVGDATITARPAEVSDRAVPGHWEGDLILGAGNRTAAITLVERATRYTMIARLPARHDATTVTDRLIEMVTALPTHLVKTLTWDQGAELAEHARFTVAADCKVYFCDPHSPWQRGTNENTNGLIREFFPKGIDFTTVPDEEIARVEQLLNTRPRATLGFHTPAVRLNELLTVAQTG
ncbi:IS30-like element ISCg2 family transposase [Terrabacter aerolatus]|uniref:IS30 family transposase n=1 Tax=Terrabacter aerolatus TaxID=422442 RepID=A0A512D717_9MICO|nr:IS30 family transposase [Terrabacter aerolatus]